jgi:predicted ester cyclase
LAFAPVTPTGKHISARSADLYKISNGKIVEQWDITDVLDVLTKIVGAVK